MLEAVTPEQARALRAESVAVSAEARALCAGMEVSALMKRPPGGGWSVAEILEHLLLTADAMLPLAEGAITALELAGRKSTRGSGLGLVGWLLVKSLEPPPRMKTKTITPFEPLDVTDPLMLVDRFVATNARLDTLIARATGLATTEVKLVSPFNASVKYNVYAAMRILLVHARRHLWQAREAKKRL
ncbi:MAG: DinB family protein [Vicinamibacteria bacterium]